MVVLANGQGDGVVVSWAETKKVLGLASAKLSNIQWNRVGKILISSPSEVGTLD